MLSTAEKLLVPKKSAWSNDQREFTFKDTLELCQFTAYEIQRSPKKYSKIAESAGCCYSTVANLANGYTTYPRAQTLFAILQVLGFEVVVRA